MEIVPTWDNPDRAEEVELGVGDKKSIIVLLDKEIVVPKSEVLRHQLESEIPFMEIGVDVPDLEGWDEIDAMADNPPPFEIFTRLPSGLIIWKDFSTTGEWKDEKEKYSELIIPDTAFMMEKLEMMIDHKRNS